MVAPPSLATVSPTPSPRRLPLHGPNAHLDRRFAASVTATPRVHRAHPRHGVLHGPRRVRCIHQNLLPVDGLRVRPVRAAGAARRGAAPLAAAPRDDRAARAHLHHVQPVVPLGAVGPAARADAADAGAPPLSRCAPPHPHTLTLLPPPPLSFQPAGNGGRDNSEANMIARVYDTLHDDGAPEATRPTCVPPRGSSTRLHPLTPSLSPPPVGTSSQTSSGRARSGKSSGATTP